MSGPLLVMPDGTRVESGGPEDRATWTTCHVCNFRGPSVGTDAQGRPACRGSCGGVTVNPDVPCLEGMAEFGLALHDNKDKVTQPEPVPFEVDATLKIKAPSKNGRRQPWDLAALVYGCELQMQHDAGEKFITDNEAAFARDIADDIDQQADGVGAEHPEARLAIRLIANRVRSEFGGKT